MYFFNLNAFIKNKKRPLDTRDPLNIFKVYLIGLRTLMPPMNGWRTSGTSTEPSSC